MVNFKIGKDTVIERTAIIEEGVTIGDNCYIGHYTIIRPNVAIGNNTEIRAHCFIAEEAKIGDHVRIFHFSNICKLAVIENYVYVGVRALLTNTKRIAWSRSYKAELEPPHICEGARIASGAIVLPGVTVGKNALVGAGSVVARDVPERQIWFGLPGRKRGTVPEEELIVK